MILLAAVSATADGHQKKSENEFLELEQKGGEIEFFLVQFSFFLFFFLFTGIYTSYSCQLIKEAREGFFVAIVFVK